jgi:hypothetical protein
VFTSIDFAGFGKKKGRVKIKSEKERLIGYDPLSTRRSFL